MGHGECMSRIRNISKLSSSSCWSDFEDSRHCLGGRWWVRYSYLQEVDGPLIEKLWALYIRLIQFLKEELNNKNEWEVLLSSNVYSNGIYVGKYLEKSTELDYGSIPDHINILIEYLCIYKCIFIFTNTYVFIEYLYLYLYVNRIYL